METPTVIIISIILFIIVFVILREFICWYYKINARIRLLEEQRDLLNLIAAHIVPEPIKRENEAPSSETSGKQKIQENTDNITNSLRMGSLR